MKVVILAGGQGTRLSGYTENLPKPLVPIGNKPILWHIMKIYSNYGFNDFIIALGYKGDLIKNYFINHTYINSNFTINTKTGTKSILDSNSDEDWNVTLIDTGLDTLTGGRLKRLQFLLNDEEDFFMTYGDGVCDININSLLDFHYKKNHTATLTAVRPIARFGEIVLKDDIVYDFKEKPQVNSGLINGGFFVLKKTIFDYLQDDKTIFESEPLENLSKTNELAAYVHDGFWHCMDTPRDKRLLDDIFIDKSFPWLK